MSDQQKKVLVIGAGYAGMLATVRLAKKTYRQNVQITLINPAETFVERLRLHQYAANQLVKQRPIAEILRGTGVRLPFVMTARTMRGSSSSPPLATELTAAAIWIGVTATWYPIDTEASALSVHFVRFHTIPEFSDGKSGEIGRPKPKRST